MSKDDKLVPELVRKTIQELNNSIDQKNDYITLLESRVQELETENYFLKRNKKIETTIGGQEVEIEISEEDRDKIQDEISTHNIEEGLKTMGIGAEDLEELGDLLDEVLGKEDEDEG